MLSKTNRARWMGILLLFVVLTTFLLMQIGRAEPAAISFSCYTLDARGLSIQGFYREEDGGWYLFVPSTLPIPQIKVYYSGSVIDTSAGQLDTVQSVISDAFQHSDDMISLTMADGTKQTITVLQSNLPAIQLLLNNQQIEELHADKSERFRLDRFVLTETSGIYDFTANNSGEIKGRGNTTWLLYDKKAYQIKFDASVPVLGMGRAKRWLLLANAGDDSLIRNQLVYRLAQNMEMDFVPSFKFVDLWINGDYRGTYLLGEKIEIDPMRLKLSHPYATLFEHDEAYYEEADYWFHNRLLNRRFVVKEIVTENEIALMQATEAFNAKVDSLSTYLYTTPSEEVTLAELSKYIDIDSFVKYYLINEYTLNCESYATSFFWYQNGPDDVLHLGPVWDFDTCIGNDGRTYTESYGHHHALFAYLLSSPEFLFHAQEIYEKYRPFFASMPEDALFLEEQLASSAEMNNLRWNVAGGTSNKPQALKFHDTFQEAVQFVREWLEQRQQFFSVERLHVIRAEVSDDCRAMEVFFDDGKSHESAMFAIENREGEQPLSLGCEGEYVDGSWHAQFDLTAMNRAGLYSIYVWLDGEELASASGKSYVKVAVGPDYPLSTEWNGAENTLSVQLVDTKSTCVSVSCAIWSEAGLQSDLVWIDAVPAENNTWHVKVDMNQFTIRGNFLIHVYGNTGSGEEFLNGIIVNIP